MNTRRAGEEVRCDNRHSFISSACLYTLQLSDATFLCYLQSLSNFPDFWLPHYLGYSSFILIIRSHRGSQECLSGRIHFLLTAPVFDGRAWITQETAPFWITLSSNFIYESPDTHCTQELHSSLQAWAPCWCMHAGDKTPGKKKWEAVPHKSRLHSHKKWILLVRRMSLALWRKAPCLHIF